MPQISTVIFDMDGVIIDSEPIHLEIVQEMTGDLGLTIADAELQSYVGSSTLEMWADIVQRYHVNRLPEKLTDTTKMRIKKHYRSIKVLPAVPGVRELIKELHQSGKKLALASSSSMEQIEIVLQKLNLKSYFPDKVSGADLPKSKPDPMIFRKAADLTDSNPVQCLVIEDSYNGVTAAKAAGMTCIGFKNEHSGNQDLSKADLVIDDFKSFDIEAFLADTSVL